MRSGDGLSSRQQDILEYIRQFFTENGYPPAIRQIQEKLAISSTSVVAYNLKALEKRGALQREKQVSRGIKLPVMSGGMAPSSSANPVPLLGVITAGVPLPNPEDTTTAQADIVDVPETLLTADKLDGVYALKVRGHSMIDALIDDGDIVLMRYQETAENGQLVAARIEDDNAVTLKRFYREGTRVRLQPANITMDPIFVDAAKVAIEGRVVGVIRGMM